MEHTRIEDSVCRSGQVPMTPNTHVEKVDNRVGQVKLPPNNGITISVRGTLIPMLQSAHFQFKGKIKIKYKKRPEGVESHKENTTSSKGNHIQERHRLMLWMSIIMYINFFIYIFIYLQPSSYLYLSIHMYIPGGRAKEKAIYFKEPASRLSMKGRQ